ncbi:hypothetical protein SRABI70_00466 [Pseudomonas sp. Bi70]|uniref:multidrug/biocide efflux PACE transporter n=1 Tax=Pseudomonas sp. Bi70 TaxID=2821127 RepID=UPI001DDA9C5B|nr:multidrug/biocide efflux PACE transporter [Pseudomonas sp. Bi70]CAH0148610.1 hypothetical protein SRABI70_00466 [Pseudomonas sp. Bi70]
MKQSNIVARRSMKERVLHATLFELIAVVVCAPLLAWAMGKSLAHMGALTLMFSAIAMLWNMLFNILFDAAQRRMGFERGLWARISHALLFEAGLILVLVPLAAWWLSISLVAAFFLDIGLILFFLPYTLGYNLAYDKLRERYFSRRQARTLACS